mmetsp:Transcript_26230/g.26473  ORF Transcript_26230/g.26473 Transcript_26230/m.26473 type:complete len:389 (+) Transcript_26230:129-1295(+)|eukprot:CAMPEP_0182428738 /NCGR_PEP_ID=MMETSP1167-20130531/23285_1 /TAXON_ID=2988 /ORGANISM="Mallomonas Sp, Strain CCMP3275" /LENGTH=388 /DNA_ID=CAMNT_0024611793 /DNA_START=119 /DNA_END=1285 /DNA_ORIENTATION=-
MDTALEEKLIAQYGGKSQHNLPQTLMIDHVSPATRLLEKRRQMFEVQEALNSQKEEFSRREDAFRRREEALRRRDLELQESLIKFNKFLQENETKRNRALKRVTDERKQREQKELEIRRLEAQHREKMAEERILKAEVERNRKYQDYLENVVQYMSKDFPEISDILNRYKTLKDVNTYLNEKQLSDEAKYENTLRDFLSYKKETENEILKKNNDIAEMQERLEHCQMRKMMLQNESDTSNDEASKKTLALGQILSSVTNILERCEESFRIRHNKPQLEKTNDITDGFPLSEQCSRSMSKLDDIAMFTIDYKDIIREYQELHTKRQSQQGILSSSTSAAGGGGASGSGNPSNSNVQNYSSAETKEPKSSVVSDGLHTSRSNKMDDKFLN